MKVLVRDVLKIAPIFKDVPWGVSVGAEQFFELVKAKVNAEELCEVPFEEFQKDNASQVFWDEYHAARVAYFVLHGWREPISIDVGIPGVCHVSWPVVDGNHRLYAAVFCQEQYIEAQLQGSVTALEEFFGEGCCLE